MKKSLYFIFAVLVTAFVASCGDKKAEKTVEEVDDSLAVVNPDTTVYGICGEGTSMHSLEIITDAGRVLTLMVNEDGDEDVVKGGLLCGDKMAVLTAVVNGDSVATKVINLTTLEGKWTGLDRNFEIADGGEVLSTLQSESNPYTSWKIYNGQLLMGRDTFNILTLGADSLEIECRRGIFVYKRM